MASATILEDYRDTIDWLRPARPENLTALGISMLPQDKALITLEISTVGVKDSKFIIRASGPSVKKSLIIDREPRILQATKDYTVMTIQAGRLYIMASIILAKLAAKDIKLLNEGNLLERDLSTSAIHIHKVRTFSIVFKSLIVLFSLISIYKLNIF